MKMQEIISSHFLTTVMNDQAFDHMAIPETKVSVFSPDVHAMTTGRSAGRLSLDLRH